MPINYCLARHHSQLRRALLGVAIAFGMAASQAAEVIQLRELAPADIEHFLAGWGNQCTARLWSESGQLIGVIQERNSLLIQLPDEVQGVTLQEPRYSKNGASYTLSGQSDFPGGMHFNGELEITTSPRLSTVGSVHHFSAMLSMRAIGSSKTASFPVRIEDACGAKSRLAYGPGGIEKIIRFLSR